MTPERLLGRLEGRAPSIPDEKIRKRRADAIKRQRLLLKMTQAQLAEYVGVSAVAVWKWESAVTTPRPAMQQKIAEALGVAHQLLFGLD